MLSDVIKEHQGDVSTEAQQAMSKAFASGMAFQFGGKRKFEVPVQQAPAQSGAAAAGSPLTGPPSLASSASVPSFAGNPNKRGKGRGGRGKGRGQARGGAAPASGTQGRGFQK